jgi:hypothetical protein
VRAESVLRDKVSAAGRRWPIGRLPDRHGGADWAGRWRLEKAARPRFSPSAHNAHAGPWAVLEAAAGPGVEQENGPRQRAQGGSPWVVRTL